MSKAGRLLKNTGILAIGSFSSKILVFLLVPLYTAALTTAEYGAYDIIFSSVSLLIPLLSLNLGDAMLRFPMEEGADVPRIARIGIGVTIVSALVVLVAQLLPNAPWAEVQGIGWLALLYLANALYQLLLLLARGSERMTDVAIAGVLSALVMLVLNVLLLLVFGYGLDGFFVANIAGMFAPALYLLVRLRDLVFAKPRSGESGLLARMVRYSLPLAMTSVGWWFINASGRFIVTAVCGMGENGLYSIAFKLPAILTTVASIFIQAWQVSAIKEFDPEDSDGFLLLTFDTVEMLLVIACAALIASSPAIAALLFTGEFYEAWIYVPPLTVLALLNTMGGMWGPFFSAEFDTAPVAVSTALGGLANVAAGIPLAMLLGVWGVIIANVLGGAVNWLYRGVSVRRHVHVDFHLPKSLAVYGALIAEGILLILPVLPIVLRVAGAFCFLVAFLIGYRKRLQGGARFIMSAIHVRRDDAN